jgi:hypothetical protein
MDNKLTRKLGLVLAISVCGVACSPGDHTSGTRGSGGQSASSGGGGGESTGGAGTGGPGYTATAVPAHGTVMLKLTRN